MASWMTERVMLHRVEGRGIGLDKSLSTWVVSRTRRLSSSRPMREQGLMKDVS